MTPGYEEVENARAELAKTEEHFYAMAPGMIDPKGMIGT